MAPLFRATESVSNSYREVTGKVAAPPVVAPASSPHGRRRPVADGWPRAGAAATAGAFCCFLV